MLRRTYAPIMSFIALSLALVMPGGVAMAIEKPEYTVIFENDGLEIRQYQSYLVAETLVKEGDIVFFCTCNEDEPEYYEDKLAISKEVAQNLVEKKIKMVGFDLPGPDFPPYELHNLFFKHNIPIVENLVNLKQITNKRCQLFALPLFIKDSDGAPCRAIAVFD